MSAVFSHLLCGGYSHIYVHNTLLTYAAVVKCYYIKIQFTTILCDMVGGLVFHNYS